MLVARKLWFMPGAELSKRAPRVPPSSATARELLSMMLVSYGAGWDCSCPQIGTSLETTRPRQSLRTETKAHFLGPLIVRRSDARRKLNRLGH